MCRFIMIIALLLSQNSTAHASNDFPDEHIPKKIRTGYALPHVIEEDQRQNYIQRVKVKLSPTIRQAIPDELVLSSSFTDKDQDGLEMAGCYIQLGSSLRPYNIETRSGNLAATSYLNSGYIYAVAALRAEETEQRVDYLTSTAQCYYWAFCNENQILRKEYIQNLAAIYFERASDDANLLPENSKITWLNTIRRENAKLLKRAN